MGKNFALTIKPIRPMTKIPTTIGKTYFFIIARHYSIKNFFWQEEKIKRLNLQARNDKILL
jgi:hypothetical protein